jgi:glycerol-3-phosphate dehydrogenase subunit B
MRLHQILVQAIQKLGGQVFQGMEAVGIKNEGDHIESVFTEAAARPTPHPAKNFILATGGILGGGIYTNHTGTVYDPIFDLPLQAPAKMDAWFKREFLHPDGHAILKAGILPNEKFQTDYDNLFAIGNVLAGDFVREHSFEGVALISAFQVAEVLV